MGKREQLWEWRHILFQNFLKPGEEKISFFLRKSMYQKWQNISGSLMFKQETKRILKLWKWNWKPGRVTFIKQALDRVLEAADSVLCSDRTLQSDSKLYDSGHTGSGQASLLKKATQGRKWERTQTAFQDFLFYFHFLFKIQHPIFLLFSYFAEEEGWAH